MMGQDLPELLLEINEISKSVMEVSRENEQLIENLKARSLNMNYFWSRNVLGEGKETGAGETSQQRTAGRTQEKDRTHLSAQQSAD